MSLECCLECLESCVVWRSAGFSKAIYLLPDDDRIVETCRSVLNNFICFNVLILCTSGNNKTFVI